MTSKYILAVSGGVDSVVLLDMLVCGAFPADGLVVAHFDHGIRSESAGDAEFVRELAEQYGLPFETKREELGAGASEELARDRRYAFLREVAKKHEAKIMTAHHADDVVETIAINLIRGTGWRGLAVLDSPDIERPLLGMTKMELLAYAKTHELQWREDATNTDTNYLRNAVRRRLQNLDEQSKQLLRAYHKRQLFLRKEVDNEAISLLGASPYSRYFFTGVHDTAALELLRAVLMRETGRGATRPQLARALLAIKTYGSGKRHEIAEGVTLRFTQTQFIVERAPVVL